MDTYYQIDQYGFGLQLTAKIPPAAQQRMNELMAKDPDKVLGFNLTPSFGKMPAILVQDLMDSGDTGIVIPPHWNSWDFVFPIYHDVAFYIDHPMVPYGCAGSFAMKNVNLRTGLVEGPPTDDPCQSYWSGGDYIPWIDGYRDAKAQAVKQFVPLHGEEEMKADVARYVGVAADDPYIDAITLRVFLNHDPEKMRRPQARNPYAHGVGLESMLEFAAAPQALAMPASGQPLEEVGMGAGALMRQFHPENTKFNAGMFLPYPLPPIVARIVWYEEWKVLARAVDVKGFDSKFMRNLADRQADYENGLWRQLGQKPVKTNVDSFPSLA